MTVEYLLNGWMVLEERDVKSFVLSVMFLIERKRKYGDPRIWLVDAYHSPPYLNDDCPQSCSDPINYRGKEKKKKANFKQASSCEAICV